MPRKQQISVKNRLRDAQALELRKAGASYDQIAKQLGYSQRSGAHHSVMRALNAAMEQRNQDAADVRELELQRLDDMLLGLWKDARSGKWLAIDRVLRIMERRAAYLGLDAPKRQEITGAEGGPLEVEHTFEFSDEYLDARVVEIVERARTRSDSPALPAPEPYLVPPTRGANGRVA